MKGVYTGSKVRLVREIRTGGGTVFKKGCVMRVVCGDRGGLTLHCFKRGWSRVVSGIKKYDVEVIEWGTAEKEIEENEH